MACSRYNGYSIMVVRSSSKRSVPIQIRLPVINNRVSNLIGKVSSCREGLCRIVAGLTRTFQLSLVIRGREGRIAIGKAGYLLNIVL